MKTIGAFMREAREAAGLTRGQLSNKAGVSVRMIWAYETDRSYPGALTIIDLSDALGIGIDEYIGHSRKEN